MDEMITFLYPWKTKYYLTELIEWLVLARALDENVIKMVEGGYALWYYESTISLLEKKFLELQQSKEPAVMIGTLANYSGTPPEDVRKEAYRLGKQYGIMVLEDNY